MALAAGTKLGPCEVPSPLGAGGMGEVYRATDTRLGREVALGAVAPDYFADIVAVEGNPACRGLGIVEPRRAVGASRLML